MEGLSDAVDVIGCHSRQACVGVTATTKGAVMPVKLRGLLDLSKAATKSAEPVDAPQPVKKGELDKLFEESTRGVRQEPSFIWKKILRAGATADGSSAALDRRIRLDARIRAECVEIVDIKDLKPSSTNAKKHPHSQIARLQENFEAFGFTTPLLVDESTAIIAGHARYEAAKASGFEHLPVVRLTHLTPAKKRALAIADNKLAELGEWDLDIFLKSCRSCSTSHGRARLRPRIIGFDTVEVDQILRRSPSPSAPTRPTMFRRLSQD